MAASNIGPESGSEGIPEDLSYLWDSLTTTGGDASQSEARLALVMSEDVMMETGIIAIAARETGYKHINPDPALVNPQARFYVCCEPPLQVDNGRVVTHDKEEDLIRNAYWLDIVHESEGADGAVIETRVDRVWVGTADAEYDNPNGVFGSDLLGVVSREVARLSLLRAAGLQLAENLHPSFTERT